ncbi:MAG: delta fatty acid desaturase [Pseudonocardiales bacterium]|nr:MAG: delta fatty acid desaturase [Pseudonocardiales bacterium]
MTSSVRTQPYAVSAPSRRGSDFAELKRRVQHAGLLDRRPGRYTARIAFNGFLLLAGGVAFVLVGDSWWQLLLAGYFGLVFTQLGFLGHDAGHRQVFRSGRANDVLGLVHANLLIGLSFDWWIGKHNRHHSHPNEVERDPDLASGALVWTAEQAVARRGLGRVIARIQAFLFFPMLLLEALNLHYASVRALVAGKGKTRIAEALMLATHFIAYAVVIFLVMSPLHAVLFIVVQQGVFGVYMGCAFAPNHKGMPILRPEDELDYLRRQVLTARNVSGGWFTQFALGGLNYQIEHHLFPSMPSGSLRRCQPLVKAFCRELSLPYAESSAWRSYTEVLRYLHRVAAPLRA